MLPPLEYLSWAQRLYGSIEYDLASSGLSQVPGSYLLLAPDALSDFGAFDRFREKLAARYGVTKGEVAFALGTSGALHLAYSSLFERGDEILVEDPAYEPVVRVAEAAGLDVRRFVRRREDAYAPSLDVIEESLTPRTRGVVLTDLHNPTGVALDHGAVAKLAARLAKTDALLVIDEVYAEACAPKRTARTLGENVVTLSSLTKCFGVGWARAGFMLAPPAYVKRAETVTMYIAGGLPPSLGAIGCAAMDRIEDLTARREELQRGKRALVDAWLAKHGARLSWVPPHPGSLFGFVHDARGEDLRPWLEEGAAKHGVLAAAGSFFGVPAAFRLGMSAPIDKLTEGLRRLEIVLDLALATARRPRRRGRDGHRRRRALRHHPRLSRRDRIADLVLVAELFRRRRHALPLRAKEGRRLIVFVARVGRGVAWSFRLRFRNGPRRQARRSFFLARDRRSVAQLRRERRRSVRHFRWAQRARLFLRALRAGGADDLLRLRGVERRRDGGRIRLAELPPHRRELRPVHGRVAVDVPARDLCRVRDLHAPARRRLHVRVADVD
jgi:aspartate/methionine/tyrosine aminotransferase